MKKIIILLFVLIFAAAAKAQPETLTNADVADMAAAGLSAEVITAKVQASRNRFDVSARSLIDLKKAGVPESVITLMLSMQRAELPAEKVPPPVDVPKPSSAANERKAVSAGRTIAFSKSSLQPSISALEKELLKRADFRALNLTIVQSWREADLSAEISFVHGSLLTHRYTYRIVDRRSGAVIQAGETTSWGSLAENLARHIAKGLSKVNS
jgi:hypothetical protein